MGVSNLWVFENILWFGSLECFLLVEFGFPVFFFISFMFLLSRVVGLLAVFFCLLVCSFVFLRREGLFFFFCIFLFFFWGGSWGGLGFIFVKGFSS